MKFFSVADKMGVSTSIGRDVPNFMKDVPNFVKDVPRVPKCFPRWRWTPDHFLMGFLNEPHWTIGDKMGVPLALGFGVPYFIKDELVT